MAVNTEELLRATYESEAAALLESIPQEFHAPLKCMAYDRGHSNGYSEMLNELSDLVYLLEVPLKAYAQRLRDEYLDSRDWLGEDQ